MEPKQITLQDDGRIFYQADPTNPLPGAEIAQLAKGEAVLSPAYVWKENLPAAQEELQAGIDAHFKAGLSILFGLNETEGLAAPVQQICKALYEGAGIVSRSEITEPLAALDNDMRAAIRAKGVRLGPLYLFCPDMNKPAAIRLRATLWALAHDMPLPAPLIQDGMVSKIVSEEGSDLTEQEKAYYQAIAYPVYARRAIRVDMLDRLVGAVYEGSDKGKFKAQHAMAEWLGAPIADLYAVLEALGHKKIQDPAEEKAEKQSEAPAQDAAPAQENATAAPVQEKPAEETVSAEKTADAKPAEAPKPELATFLLKPIRNNQKSSAKPFHKKTDKPQKSNKAQKPKRKDKENRKPQYGKAPEESVLRHSPFAMLQGMTGEKKD